MGFAIRRRIRRSVARRTSIGDDFREDLNSRRRRSLGNVGEDLHISEVEFPCELISPGLRHTFSTKLNPFGGGGCSKYSEPSSITRNGISKSDVSNKNGFFSLPPCDLVNLQGFALVGKILG
ncbi:hypothetical protein ABFS82_11G000300 [Erythranthe guttata]